MALREAVCVPLEQAIVLAIPGSPAVDPANEQGLAALGILRAMGLPTLVGLVQTSGNSLKEKSAAKKRGSALLASEVRWRCRRGGVSGCCTNTFYQGHRAESA